MEMEGGNAEGKGDNWSIYRDSFTPSTLSHDNSTNNKPKPRPWERAPVPAHAPRLAGQKIWKKASSLQATTASSLALADKENAVQADLELEKGGMGSRKRRRGVPCVGGKGKENIAEARWMVVDGSGAERAVDGTGNAGVSPRKAGIIAVLNDEDAFVVPRKRTNANHMITPRKPLGRIENAVVAPVLQLRQSPAKALKSPAKSPPRGTKVPLNDREGAELADKEVEKPRRRKSMRKSRRLTMSELVGESNEERRGSFVFGQKGGDNGVESFSGVETSPAIAGTQSEETSAKTEPSTDSQDDSPHSKEAAVIASIVEASENQESISTGREADAAESLLSEAEASQSEGMAATSQLEACEQAEEQFSTSDMVESSDEIASKLEEFSDGVNESLDKQSGLENSIVNSTAQDVELQTIEEQAVESSNLSSELGTITEQQPQTPLKVFQAQPPMLDSPAPSITTLLSPTKLVSTPRSRRKTPQRSATRRSTRTSRSRRASSVAREDTPAQAAPTSEAPDAEIIVAMPAVGETSSIDLINLNSGAHVSEEAEAEQNDSDGKVHGMTVTEPPSEAEQLTEIIITSEVLATPDVVENTTEAQPGQDHISTEQDTRELTPTVEFEGQDEAETSSLEQESCDEQLRHDLEISTPKHKRRLAVSSSPISGSPPQAPASEEISEESAETFELIEPMSMATSENALSSPTDEASEELPESTTPDPTTTELTKAISENAPPSLYDHDDTDMLRNFLSKVKANKAAKAKTSIPKRKRSLPHSPLQIPLETVDSTTSPCSPKEKDEFDVSLPQPSPTKRRKRNEPAPEAPQEVDATESRSIRRSGRTRLPVKAAPAAPSFIPVRRLGQDGDSTVTLRRNEEKELAALTKVNTRKNKGGASHPLDFLAKKAEEKDDPAARQRALKEVFDEKNYKQKLNKKGNTVVWAEELAQFQTEEGKKIILTSLAEIEGKQDGKKVTIVEKEPERETEKPILPGDEKKSASSTPKVKVGMRSKMTLGMAANGTPAPKRRVRARS